MHGRELRVEEAEVPGPEPGHAMNQGDPRGVTLVREHAFVEERRAQADAVEPADQPAVLPGLDHVACPRARKSPTRFRLIQPLPIIWVVLR